MIGLKMQMGEDADVFWGKRRINNIAPKLNII